MLILLVLLLHHTGNVFNTRECKPGLNVMRHTTCCASRLSICYNCVKESKGGRLKPVFLKEFFRKT